MVLLNLPARQLVQTEAPAAENVPAAHKKQSGFPSRGPYLPASHSMQVLALSREYKPALQTVHTVLPS
jgi:hypothetical protein